MNYKEKFLEMEREFAKESSRDPIENIQDLKLAFIFKFQILNHANTYQKMMNGLLF